MGKTGGKNIVSILDHISILLLIVFIIRMSSFKNRFEELKLVYIFYFKLLKIHKREIDFNV